MYYICTIEDNKKRFSYAEKIHRNHNLAAYIKWHPHITVMMVARSKKEAESIAEDWNEAAEADGQQLTFEEWKPAPNGAGPA